MHFLAEAKRYVVTLPVGTKERVAIEYMLENAVGWENAKPWPEIEAHLNDHKIRMSKNTFQASVVGPSRAGKVFIGSTDSGIKGYFIIAKSQDGRVMRAWYEKRINKEQANLDNLNKLLKEEWNI